MIGNLNKLKEIENKYKIMENKEWLKEMLGVEVTMKGNELTFSKGLGLIEDEKEKT